MAKAKGIRPDIAGGRTLSRMRRGGGKGGGAGGAKNRRPVWFQVGKEKGEDRGKLGSWPCGEMPEHLRKRLEGGGQ